MPASAAPTLHAIYVRLPNWVGDVCMSLPCLDTLIATGAPVVACARPWARDLLSAYELAGFVPMAGNWRADRSAVHAWRKKSHHARTVGLLLPDSLSSAMVFRFAGVPCAGYRDDGRSLILRWPMTKPRAPMHAVQSWFHLTRLALERWGLPAGSPTPEDALDWRPAGEHIQAARAAAEAAGVADTPFVLIAPTAVGLHKGRIKVWQGFDSLAQSLQARGYPVLMAPPPAERDAALAAAPTAQCLPPLPLGAFAVLTRLAAMTVCNDSGVSHIAAAADARQITLFGVTDPARTGPWSPRAIRLGGPGAWPTAPEVLSAALSLLEPPQAA
ncbi:glycosyltransferase family 9 protein [Castellaniella sp. GW247-6E4]|uniref:glycosyltransferase family 9 protein n=1 Tax=Castellaniella sp. GW247-6E4 TaxID=3140380 RepID=UPI003315714F